VFPKEDDSQEINMRKKNAPASSHARFSSGKKKGDFPRSVKGRGKKKKGELDFGQVFETRSVLCQRRRGALPSCKLSRCVEREKEETAPAAQERPFCLIVCVFEKTCCDTMERRGKKKLPALARSM